MKGTSDESSTAIGLRSLDEVGINYELRASDGSNLGSSRLLSGAMAELPIA
jgi:hypothetical protein